MGIVGCVVGIIGTLYGCRRGYCRRLCRQTWRQFRNGKAIINIDPGPISVEGQSLSLVSVAHDPTHDYLHVLNDDYDEITFDSTLEVSQSTEDNNIYHEINHIGITQRGETHLYDGSLDPSFISSEPSYVVGRIAERSGAPVAVQFAVAEQPENVGQGENNFAVADQLVNAGNVEVYSAAAPDLPNDDLRRKNNAVVEEFVNDATWETNNAISEEFVNDGARQETNNATSEEQVRVNNAAGETIPN
ncbi:uncharacterized protein LOC127874248 [Dreissena polymorpha]|nr:uncharacterized protein LOC127874248 [Dreissena polymorpha]